MRYCIPYTVPNKFRSPDSFTLDGEIGSRFDRFVHERISGNFATDYIWKEAEDCFADQYDDEFAPGMWRSEFWGKLALSAARVCRMNEDDRLREQIRHSAYRVLSFQRTDGYLSTYRNSESIFPPDPVQAKKDVGWDCPYNWNIWGQKYTLWALIEIAQLLDDQTILNAACRMADFLVAQIDRLGVRVKDVGTMNGMAPSSILKPMLLLYRLTGNECYHTFAKNIAREWVRDDNEMPNLITNSLSGVPVSDWYDRSQVEWYAKAYEMTSCMDGLCELYRIDGDPLLLAALEGYWNVVKADESNVLGSVGYCEQFYKAASHPNAATEVCDVIHWMRLSYELFCLTGEAKYMAAMENAFLNAFLAGIYEDGKNGAFFVRAAGRHWAAEPQVQTKYQHCCVNNAARGFVNMAECGIMTDGVNYFINQYIPTRVRFGDTMLRVSSGYTDSGSLTVTVRNAKVGTKLHCRVPDWVSDHAGWFAVLIDGEKQSLPVENGYVTVTLTCSDMFVKLAFDMTTHVIALPTDNIDLPDGDYHKNRWCDGGAGPCGLPQMLHHPACVLRRGPVLLARSKRIGNTEDEMFHSESIFGKNAAAEARVFRHDRMLTACHVKLTYDGNVTEFDCCDYASAGNRELDDPSFFSIYM